MKKKFLFFNNLVWWRQIILFWLIWRVGLFLLAWLATYLLPYRPSFPYAEALLANSNLPAWIYSWANFDGVHYLTIAKQGYLGTGLIQAFFPLYPLLISLLGRLGISDILAGLLVGNLSFLSFLLLSYLLIKRVGGEELAKISIGVILTFPTSFYFGALYGESLFVLLAAAGFYFCQQKRWGLAAAMVALASATRIVGIFLLAALWWSYWQENRKISIERWRHLAIWSLVGAAGLLIYMFYLQVNFHDPLYFYHVQSEFGGGRQEKIILFPQVVWRYLKILASWRWSWAYWAFIQEFVFALAGLWLLFWPWFERLIGRRRLRLKLRSDDGLVKIPGGWLLFAWLAFLLPTLTGTFSSLPRYVLVCLPIFVLIAQHLSSHRWRRWFYFSLSTLGLIINTILFIQGYWVA